MQSATEWNICMIQSESSWLFVALLSNLMSKQIIKDNWNEKDDDGDWWPEMKEGKKERSVFANVKWKTYRIGIFFLT